MDKFELEPVYTEVNSTFGNRTRSRPEFEQAGLKING